MRTGLWGDLALAPGTPADLRFPVVRIRTGGWFVYRGNHASTQTHDEDMSNAQPDLLGMVGAAQARGASGKHGAPPEIDAPPCCIDGCF